MFDVCLTDFSILLYYSHVMFYSVFFFKQKTAYEMRISYWSSDVCSSDLSPRPASFCCPRTIWCRTCRASSPLSTAPPRRPRKAGSSPSARSDERRVGKECVSTCKSRCSPHHSNTKGEIRGRHQRG